MAARVPSTVRVDKVVRKSAVIRRLPNIVSDVAAVNTQLGTQLPTLVSLYSYHDRR
jgi:hypothetical protein